MTLFCHTDLLIVAQQRMLNKCSRKVGEPKKRVKLWRYILECLYE